MFEITWWCVVVSLLLGTVVWLDARRYRAGARVPPVAWAIVVGVTWVGSRSLRGAAGRAALQS